MKIEISPHSGFCMGVRSAVLKIVKELNTSPDPIHVHGPIIHNPQTTAILEKRGLRTVGDDHPIAGETVAIRTHGIPRDELSKIRHASARVINLTCPRVAKVQAIINKHSRNGAFTIITGDEYHAEVIGLKSYARSGVMVIPDTGKISEIPTAERYIVVSQTTFDRDLFEKIISLLKEKLGNRLVVFDTICDSTRDRQSDVASAIARGIDVLVVVGGRNSANTRRLADIGRERGIRTFHVETADELPAESFKKNDHVFITAGASTPGWIINNVLEKLFSIQYSHRGFIVNGAKKLIEFIVRTNVLSSFAAFFLTAFSIFYFTGNSTCQLPLAAALYLFSMYSFNNCLTAPQLRESNPYKYQLYHLHRLPFLIAASLGTLIALLLVIPLGPAAWGMYFASSVLGIVYSMNFFQAMIKKPGIALLSKAYNSKTLVTSFGWVIVCALVPLVTMRAPLYAYPAMLCFIFGFVFLRNIMLDIIGLQGDLILGRETLPILLGLKPAVRIAAAAGFFCFAVFCIVTATRGNIAFLIPAAAYPYYLILVHRIGKMEYLAALKYEFLTDMNFIIFIVLYWVSSSL
jgi:4-hydroxy-3-methylbut-2-enyl diphosphate reductase